MKKYRDLDLKKIRELADLDFAHFTYQKGMCTCCYSPRDFPKLYWKNNVIPKHDNYTYLLFNNANNGRGIVTGDNIIANYTCIRWRMNREQLDLVCKMLLDQLDDDYVLGVPKDKKYCIIIFERGRFEEYKEKEEKDYIFLFKDVI